MLAFNTRDQNFPTQLKLIMSIVGCRTPTLP
jgi:hypothetical protein